MRKTLLLNGLIFCALYSSAQIRKVTPMTDITVIEYGDTLKNSFAGGISSPGYSTMDLNNDHINDLVIFDKDGQRVSCFINKGTYGKIDYTYAPQYNKNFPAGMYDWMLLRDYNGDGKEDIFTQGPGGIRIYKNVSTASEINFIKVTDELAADYGGGSYSNIAVFAPDIPEINDIDNDGDLDIFFFKSNHQGNDQIRYFKNLSQELTGSPGALNKYVLYKNCWGKFVEDYSGCTVTLQASDEDCANGEKGNSNSEEKTNHHGSSSLLIFDANGDGKKDILIGDDGCNSMYLLTNTGTNDEAIMTNVVYNYPSFYPIDIFTFPCAFYIDINNDNRRDLLAASSLTRGTGNYNTTWVYLNNGTDESPSFSFLTMSFLQDQMIDVKQNASPHFFDYDNDGKTDMAITNSGSWSQKPGSASIDSASISMYKNTGNNESPVYELISSDYSNISQYHFLNLTMSTADIDRDGDTDLMLGEEDGKLYYFQNTSSPHSAAQFQLHTASYQNIDISKYSIPFFTDINHDQKPDLLLGGRAGNSDSLFLFIDTSTGSLPEYKRISNMVGGIHQHVPFSTGMSFYFNRDYDGKGTNALFVAKGNIILFYDSIASDLSGTFHKTDSIRTDAGQFIRITMHDLNGDGKKELIAGTASGGLLAYEIEYMNNPATGLSNSYKTSHAFSAYPNPANSEIQIVSKNKTQIIDKIELYDIAGKMMWSENNIHHSSYHIATNTFQNGSYLLRIYSNEIIATKIILVNR